MLGYLILSTAVAVLPQSGRTDTTIAVRPGTRVSVANAGGEVVVRSWDRSEVRVRAEHSSRAGVALNLEGSVLRIEARSTRGRGPAMAGVVDYDITVPARTAIEIGGMYADVTLEGTRGDVRVNTIEGDLSVRGAEGTISLTTINGDIDVRGARGRVELRSTSDDIFAEDVEGELTAETVSGDIELRRINVSRLEAQTVSGDVTFTGTIRNDGSYVLVTHSGDVVAGIPEGSNVTVRAAVASGDVETEFPVTAGERQNRRRQTFRIGTGSATLDMETFSGDIRLVRPASVSPRRGREN